jgi:beta-glucosidase
LNIDQIIGELTIDEKITLLSGNGTYDTKPIPHAGISSITLCDGPHGVRKRADSERTDNLMHKSSVAVCYPCLSACANSWDEALLSQIGSTIAREARAKQIQIILGPGVNIKRNPLCGRNFEYISEDPLLSGKLGAAWVRGLQQEDVGASVKHFCCNNQEHFRMTSSSELDERTLREIYLKSFEIVVRESNPATVMCSYNRINGVFASDHVRLMRDVLVNEWGFSGFTVTDWGAMNDRVAGIQARLSLEMPDSLGFFDDDIRSALKKGVISESDLDDCLRPMLMKVMELSTLARETIPVDLESNHAFARSAAAKSAVLMRNDGTLPLRAQEKICVIGSFAQQPRYQGTGSSRVNAYRVDTLLEGLTEHGFDYQYEPGFPLTGEADERLLDQAIQAANDCDVILLALGLPESLESEGFDRESLSLPEIQNKLVARASKLDKRVVVVLYGGGVMETPWIDQVNAILFMGLGGEGAGTATADILSGRVNPSGKLAESWPIAYQDHITSSYWQEDGQQAFYREGIYVGYRYYDKANLPVQFAFGHGLSYTTFAYSDLQIVPTAEGYRVSCSVRNVGNVAGEETVQLYLHAKNGHVFKPEQELKAFQKRTIAPGETALVELFLPREAFRHYDAEQAQWLVENGAYEIRIGSGSRDIRLQKDISVSFGTECPELNHGWYHSIKGIPTIADLEQLMGHSIPRRGNYQRGTYDLNSSLQELSKDSILARIILAAGRQTIAKGLGIKPDLSNPEYRMMVTVSETAPLRNLALSAPRSMSKGLVKFLLLTANGIQQKKKETGK